MNGLNGSKILFYQLTRLTRERGALSHDDALDALAMACGYWVNTVAQDAERRRQELVNSREQKVLDEFMEHVKSGKAVSLYNASKDAASGSPWNDLAF